MLIVDVSKTLGDLAEAINKKSATLDRLEQEYRSKLEILNRYISKLEVNSNEMTAALVPQDEILSLIGTKRSCPHCQNIIYDPKNDSDYVLIPKSHVEILHDKRLEGGATKGNGEKTPAGIVGSDKAEEQASSALSSRKGKLKKTCSYCNKPGHSRARCFSRLTTPLESHKVQDTP